MPVIPDLSYQPILSVLPTKSLRVSFWLRGCRLPTRSPIIKLLITRTRLTVKFSSHPQKTRHDTLMICEARHSYEPNISYLQPIWDLPRVLDDQSWCSFILGMHRYRVNLQ
ncbi:hypothetical protein Hdeb2414_s0380g00881301 [Helianthus debilis subsp. tardiflorus]